tara:strand:- start:897 stop:1091 length:195 start_codon:yes stop_codon:yes gene_type:complete
MTKKYKSILYGGKVDDYEFAYKWEGHDFYTGVEHIHTLSEKKLDQLLKEQEEKSKCLKYNRGRE